MKAKIFSLIIILALFFSSCVKEQFDVPPSNCDSLNKVVANLSIAQLKSKYDGDTVALKGDLSIEGTVISTDQFGNFYKKIVIEDTSGGIEIEINDTYMFTNYPVGQKLMIKLNGLVLGEYKGILELGKDYNLANGIIRLEPDDENIFLLKKCEVSELKPKVITIDKINDDMLNTLVKIENVQFTKADSGQTWADSDPKINRHLIDQNSDTLQVRTSKYASFAADTLPNGSGTIVGVLGKHDSDYQLYIRNLDDVSMDNPRF